MLPLIKFLPQVRRWRVRSRIYRWYGELTLLERDVRLRERKLPTKRWLSDLDRIQRGVERVVTPASFASEAYTLREHIDLVRRAVLARRRPQKQRPSQAEPNRRIRIKNDWVRKRPGGAS